MEIIKKIKGKLNDVKINDDEIVKEIGMSIPECFEKYGEAEFRKVETQVIKEISKEKLVEFSKVAEKFEKISRSLDEQLEAEIISLDEVREKRKNMTKKVWKN